MSSLTAFLAEHRVTPFEWGTANCCHFAAAWVEFRTGFNPMRGLPPTDTKIAAYRLISDLGGSLRAAWSSRMGVEPIPASFAQIGDVVLIESRNVVGVCAGSCVMVAEAGGAVAFLPMSEAVCAWRIE